MSNLTVTANQSKRTFTIRKYDENGKLFSKYRTFQKTKDEFEELKNCTPNDWERLLATTYHGDEIEILK